MIYLYNATLILFLILVFPFLLIKILLNKRFRYHFLDRVFPKPIEKKDYFLIHASSFGETKTIAAFLENFERELKLKPVMSVFTDTAHLAIKGIEKFIMPIDLIFFYKIIFRNPPRIAIFFEGELWPSYIHVLKKRGSKLVLLNAKMSKKSFKRYRKLSFLFKRTISSFDLIISKSKEDAKRYRFFNKNTIVCGNIKSCMLQKTEEIHPKEEFLISNQKPVLTLASFHKEEIDLAIHLIKKFNGKFFIILAPRHMEDIPLFEKYLTKNRIDFTKRSQRKEPTSVLLLDTLGELPKAYSFSAISIVGGSFHKSLKGHNPIEPVVYSNITICGPYMESFDEEIKLLKKNNLVFQTKNDGTKAIEEIVKIINMKLIINTDPFFKNISYILNCHLFNTISVLKN